MVQDLGQNGMCEPNPTLELSLLQEQTDNWWAAYKDRVADTGLQELWNPIPI